MEHIKNSMSSLFNGKRQLTADEYLGGDGLICCKNCKTPRQVRSEDNGEMLIFPTLCKCVSAAREAEEKARQKAEWERKINELRINGISNPAYRKYTFEADDGKSPAITQTCKSFVNKFEEAHKIGGGLILWGGVGTGKTFFAMCIANALINKGYAVQCTSLAAVVKQAQDFDNAESHFNRLMRKHLIIIDDLGTERSTTFAHEQIYKFIDGCNTYNIPLIFTTNYTPSLLSAAAEDVSDLTFARIYSRVLEKCLPVKVNDIKRRADNAQINKAQLAALLGLNNDVRQD